MSLALYFEKQRVFVSGANGQLGQAVSESFLSQGATVYATDIQDDCRWARPSDKLHYLKLDITSRDQVTRVFDRIFEHEDRLDVVINNAGVACFEPFLDRLEENFDRVMDVNLKGTFNCIQAYSRKMIQRSQKEGRIVNIASIYGVVSPDPRIYTDCARNSSEVYGATKAGVVQMSRYFAVHLAQHGIRVNCVSPGGIFNPQSPQGDDFVSRYSQRCPMGRMAKVEEMLGAIHYFSSPTLSTYTTGQNLSIDGGLSCW